MWRSVHKSLYFALRIFHGLNNVLFPCCELFELEIWRHPLSLCLSVCLYVSLSLSVSVSVSLLSLSLSLFLSLCLSVSVSLSLSLNTEVLCGSFYVLCINNTHSFMLHILVYKRRHIKTCFSCFVLFMYIYLKHFLSISSGAWSTC